jgi:hypothetical protein
MRLPHPTYGSVTATIALIAALGGTSYAAVTITGKNIRNDTITSADIRNDSIASRDIDNGSVTGSDLKNGSVTGTDVDDGSLSVADFKPGELPAGPAGPQGPQGPAGTSNVVTRRVNAIVPPVPTPPGSTTQSEIARCQSGETAVGGGAGITGVLAGKGGIVLTEPVEADGSEPEDGEVATGWRAVGLNTATVPQVMNVHVLCASS